MHLYYPKLQTTCKMVGSWKGISSYDLYPIAISTDVAKEDDASDDKSVTEIIQDLPWYIQLAIYCAFVVCLATLSCICRVAMYKSDEKEPLQLMNPIASEVPNFTNRSDVFNATNYNLLS